MSDVVNLNRFRKKKRREAAAKQADINRVRHGRTKAQKERELADRNRLTRLIDGKRLDAATPSEDAPAAEPSAPPGSVLSDDE